MPTRSTLSAAALAVLVFGTACTGQTTGGFDPSKPASTAGPAVVPPPMMTPSLPPDSMLPAGVDAGTGSPTSAPPTGVCGAGVDKDSPALPRPFYASCAGCHSPFRGPAAAGVPSLFAYTGTAAAFVERVRQGGKLMPGFDERAISTLELEAAFTYFARATSGAAACAPEHGRVRVPADACSGKLVEVARLFTSAPPSPAMVAVDERGVLVTRGAGRVRGRHELETEFSPFLPLYFENRSYHFTVEDEVARGGSAITITYVPLGKPAETPVTNLRLWKVYGAGNVFHQNVDMKKVDGDGRRLQWTVDRNGRDNRAIQKGDVLEFEFGVFLDPAANQGRTNYYSDTFRYRVGEGGLTAANFNPALGALGPGPAGMAGGGTTIPYVVAEPALSLEQLALNVQPATVQRFLEGRRLFHTSFLSGEHSETGNPVFTAHKGKAGPLFNQESCTSCHPHNGRGAPPEAGAPMRSMVVKVFGDGSDAAGAPLPHPLFGQQLQDHGTGADGEASLTYQPVTRTLDDGTTVELLRPTVTFGPGEAPTHHSPRVARPLVGMGLLEAIAEQSLLALADEGDCNGDGISGRANVVRDPETGVPRLGRFGWKASKVSVRHQVAEAALLDLGVTSRMFPNAECGRSTCPDSAPELSDDELDRLTTYMRALGVPARRLDDPQVQRGQALFSQVGCSACHTPAVATGAEHPQIELRGQLIYPYSDLLLHDMGPDLADESQREHLATPSEWRTPPLWAIGLTAKVSGHTRFLHDGRARTLLEAILWHGGEAEGARKRVSALPAADRQALLTFLGSL